MRLETDQQEFDIAAQVLNRILADLRSEQQECDTVESWHFFVDCDCIEKALRILHERRPALDI